MENNLDQPQFKISKEYMEFISGNYKYINPQDLQRLYLLIKRQIEIDQNLNDFDRFEALKILKSAKETYIWGIEL